MQVSPACNSSIAYVLTKLRLALQCMSLSKLKTVQSEPELLCVL